MIVRPTARSGFSLMEVVVSLAIFLLSVIALAQLLNLSMSLARDGKELQRASQLCRSKMNEVVAGAVSLTSQPESTFEEDPNWVWSMECQQESSITNLWRVTVTVAYHRQDGSTVQDTLTQYVLDPAARGTLDAGASSSTEGGTTTAPMGGN